MRIIKFLLISIVFSGCERLFIEPNPENTPENNFEMFWNSFEEHYALFEIKKIDWHSIYNTYRPQVNSSTTDRQLYTALVNMIYELKDGHADIYPDFDAPSSLYDKSLGYPENSPENAIHYIENVEKTWSDEKGEYIFQYGNIKNTELGYIRIYTFEGNVNPLDLYSNKDFERIDEILAEFKNKKGLVIDIRSNGGGSDFLSKIVAARFTDKKVLWGYITWRNGKNYSDVLTKERYFEHRGEYFDKPVAVLINRNTYSAGEGFASMMDVLPQAKLFGGNTGGGSGGGAYFELPNGWSYRVTTNYGGDANGFCYENAGIAPDYDVTITDADIANKKDRILEEAVKYLNN